MSSYKLRKASKLTKQIHKVAWHQPFLGIYPSISPPLVLGNDIGYFENLKGVEPAHSYISRHFGCENLNSTHKNRKRAAVFWKQNTAALGHTVTLSILLNTNSLDFEVILQNSINGLTFGQYKAYSMNMILQYFCRMGVTVCCSNLKLKTISRLKKN